MGLWAKEAYALAHFLGLGAARWQVVSRITIIIPGKEAPAASAASTKPRWRSVAVAQVVLVRPYAFALNSRFVGSGRMRDNKHSGAAALDEAKCSGTRNDAHRSGQHRIPRFWRARHRGFHSRNKTTYNRTGRTLEYRGRETLLIQPPRSY